MSPNGTTVINMMMYVIINKRFIVLKSMYNCSNKQHSLIVHAKNIQTGMKSFVSGKKIHSSRNLPL